MVVKNVTGYDLHKGHIGALGTLGLITRVNLKVGAAADQRAHGGLWLRVGARRRGRGWVDREPCRSRPPAVDLIDRRLVTAAEAPDRPWLLAARFAGTEAGVAAQLAMVHEALALEWGRAQHPAGARGPTRLLARRGERGGTAPNRRAVYGVPHEAPSRRRFHRCSGPRRTIAAEHGLEWRAEAHAVSGVGRVRWTGGDQRGVLPCGRRPAAAPRGLFDAPVVVEATSPDVKRRLDVWGTDPSNAAHALADSSAGGVRSQTHAQSGTLSGGCRMSILSQHARRTDDAVRPEPVEGPFMVRQAHHERLSWATRTVRMSATTPIAQGRLQRARRAGSRHHRHLRALRPVPQRVPDLPRAAAGDGLAAGDAFSSPRPCPTGTCRSPARPF